MFRVVSKYKLHTQKELLYLLGLSTSIELDNLILNKEAYFKKKKIDSLDWYENPKETRYGLTPVRKMRFVHNRIQQTIAKDLFSHLPEGIMGGRPGCSPKKMAKLHCAKQAVVRIDIEKCFDSITPAIVYRMFCKLLNYQCSPANAKLLTDFLTIKNKLPQGSPASPTICNCVLSPVFNAVLAYCQMHNLTLTSWVDDFFVSGQAKEVFSAIPKIVYLLEKAGYRVNRRKIDLSLSGDRMEVVGLVLGIRPSVSRDRREALRKQLIQALLGDNRISTDRLKGKLAHVRRYNPGYARRLDLLMHNVIKLREKK